MTAAPPTGLAWASWESTVPGGWPGGWPEPGQRAPTGPCRRMTPALVTVICLRHTAQPRGDGRLLGTELTDSAIFYSVKHQGIRNDGKRKETRRDTDGTIILFLYPLIFDTKIPRD